MVTETGAYVQTKLMRPCLDVERATPQMWSEHLTSALPSLVYCVNGALPGLYLSFHKSTQL